MPDVILNHAPPLRRTFGACGAFGKIASAGDFIRFAVAGDFVPPWDDWLQAELLAARETLGSRWREVYLSAPMWRFTLAPGVAGKSAAIGVLMPSTDRVGRMFPLTLVVPVTGDHALAALHFAGRAFFEAVENLALATLNDLPLDDLRAQCAAIAAPVPAIPAAPPRARAMWFAGAEDAAPALAALQMPQGEGQCMWSARLATGLCLMRSDGLPREADFVALLDADAQVWRQAATAAGAAT